jgi:hypothetical protein
MIHGYKKIALVYGQSTNSLAKKVKDYIEETYTSNGYPIEVKLCNDETFRQAKEHPEINNVIANLFAEVEFAIILIGKDMLTYRFNQSHFSAVNGKENQYRIVSEELFSILFFIIPTLKVKK